MPSEHIRNQLAHMAHALEAAVKTIKPREITVRSHSFVVLEDSKHPSCALPDQSYFVSQVFVGKSKLRFGFFVTAFEASVDVSSEAGTPKMKLQKNF